MLLSWIPAPDFHIILNRLSVIMLLFNNSMEQRKALEMMWKFGPEIQLNSMEKNLPE